MNATKHNLPRLTAPRPLMAHRGDGFYHCSHCHTVVTPSAAQVEVAENAPDANPTLKCPHCHKYTVHWRMPSSAYNHHRPHSQPVSAEHGRELFAGIFRMLAAV